MSWSSRLKTIVRQRLTGSRLTDPYYISHSTLSAAIRRVGQQVSADWLLDIGCGTKPYRGYLSAQHYIGIDLPTYGPQAADLFGSALQLPFRDVSYDAVLCTEVLEHVPDPNRLFREIARLLEPGGVLILTTPQTWGLHLEPFDYFRYTRYGLETLATSAGLDVQSVQPTCGVWATLGQRAVDAIYTRYGADKPLPIRGMVLMFCAIWLTLALAQDYLGGHQGDTLDNVLIAIKPASQRSQSQA
jgi:SAM-dependent methyltransferase